MATTSGITEETVDDIAREASASTISVLRRLLRLPVRPKCAERIDRVLIERGYLREGDEAPRGNREKRAS